MSSNSAIAALNANSSVSSIRLLLPAAENSVQIKNWDYIKTVISIILSSHLGKKYAAKYAKYAKYTCICRHTIFINHLHVCHNYCMYNIMYMQTDLIAADQNSLLLQFQKPQLRPCCTCTFLYFCIFTNLCK